MSDADDTVVADATGVPHRLHPLSLVFHVGRALRVVLVPMMLVLVARREGGEPWWVGLFVIPGLLHSVVHYLNYRYRFDGDELVVQGGLVFRFERHIPYARIQNIDLVQGPVQRLLGVADVRIETGSGSSEEEAHLQVLSLAAVDAMRRQVAEGRRAVSVPLAGREPIPEGAPAASRDTASTGPPARVGDPGRVVLRLGARDLVAFGLISNRGMAVVLAAFGLLQQFEIVPEDLDESRVRELESLQPEGWQLLAFGLVVVVALRLLSVGWAVLNLSGFELRRTAGDLQTRCGLLTRHTATIPRDRIQVVTVTETLLHRLTRTAAVKVDTAGGSKLEEQSSSRRWVAPIIRRADVPALLEELVPGAEFGVLDWSLPDDRARRRLTGLWCKLGLACGACLAVASIVAAPMRDAVPADAATGDPWNVIAPLLLASLVCAWGTLDARLRVPRLGYALGSRTLHVRHGLWTRRTRIVRYAKVQSASLVSTPFDRRWGMASFSVDTAGTDFPVGFRYLSLAAAESVHARLVASVSATDFRW